MTWVILCLDFHQMQSHVSAIFFSSAGGGFIKKSYERKNQPSQGSIIFLGKSQESSQNPLLTPLASCIITSYMRRLLEIIYISSGDRRQLHKKIDFPLTFFHVNSSSVKRAFHTVLENWPKEGSFGWNDVTRQFHFEISQCKEQDSIAYVFVCW